MRYNTYLPTNYEFKKPMNSISIYEYDVMF